MPKNISKFINNTDPRNEETYSIVISGVGGQGLITLLRIITNAALQEKYEIKTSELHGLSQRGGSVEVHIRFGRKIWSPLIGEAKANMIISLEAQEALQVSHYASEKTIFLINNNFVPIPDKPLLTSQQILKNLIKISSRGGAIRDDAAVKKIFLIPASEICKNEFGSDVVAGIYLLGCAVYKNLIPLKPDSIIMGIKETVPEKYFELNKKAFEMAKSHDEQIIKK